MKYYHIHIGKTEVNVERAEEYRIDSMADLVEDLPNISFNGLMEMFEHISTVHRDDKGMFDHFIDGIGQCDEGAACSNLLRSRARGRRFMSGAPADEQSEKPQHIQDEDDSHILSFFNKCHSFLFHPNLDDYVSDVDEIEDGMDEEKDSKPQQMNAEYGCCKSVDYRFGVWIDYTANIPFFDSLKEEMMGNDVYPMTSNQWQDTLTKAQDFLDSVRGNERYRAKRPDKKYGVQIGQKLGIENVMAILIYCNYTDLQTRFSETFRVIQDGDTAEMIVERHCRNFYWLGRCGVFLLTLSQRLKLFK